MPHRNNLRRLPGGRSARDIRPRRTPRPGTEQYSKRQHHHHRRLRAGRHCRHAGAADRARSHRAPAPDRRGRKPRRRRRQYRSRPGRACPARRLHAPRHHDRIRHQRNAVRQQAIRGERFQDRRHRRFKPGSAGDRPRQSGEQSRRFAEKRRTARRSISRFPASAPAPTSRPNISSNSLPRRRCSRFHSRAARLRSMPRSAIRSI